MKMNTAQSVISWILQVVAAVILLQTLFFKFTGAEESKYIFTTLGIEPWGRIGTGVLELIAAALLLTPRTVTIGAILSCGLMCGEIMGHLTKLGIVVKDDGGLLFGLACTVLISCAIVVAIRREQIPVVGNWLQMHAHQH